MRLFLGVDGGQSSTTALIADETGRVLGSGVGGPCNHARAEEGRAKFTRAIDACLQQACAQAGLDRQALEFESACLGFSGGPADKEPILRELLKASHLLITNDALIALSGATAGEPGIITIAGTGSIALGRNAGGRVARAGGWGYVYGDEGGAFHITRQALRAALRSEEGWGPPTALRRALLEATASANANDLLHRFYTTDFTRPQIAAFARLVDEAAGKGDAVALDILRSAGQELAALTLAVHSRLFKPGERVRAAYIGGVFHSERVLSSYRGAVAMEVQPPEYSPSAGALLEAYRAAGLSVKLSAVPQTKT